MANPESKEDIVSAHILTGDDDGDMPPTLGSLATLNAPRNPNISSRHAGQRTPLRTQVLLLEAIGPSRKGLNGFGVDLHLKVSRR